MAQFARPDSDVSAGLWTTAPLWQKIDEATASDADLISSDNNTTPGVCEVGLSNVTDPNLSTGHTVRYRYRKSASGGHVINVRVSLYQGTTLIAEQLHSNVSEVFTAGSFTLTTTQADAITDYTDLRIRFAREGDTGGPGGNRRSADISWAELEVPDPVVAGTAGTQAATTYNLYDLAGLAASATYDVEEPAAGPAFPQVVDDVTSVESTDTLTHDVPLPAGSGGLLIAFATVNGIPTISNLPWGIGSPDINLNNNNDTAKLIVFHKWADGSEAASSFTTSVAEQSVIRVLRITGAQDFEFATDVAGGAFWPNPPILNPSGWDVEDTLWLAVAGYINGNTNVVTYPANYTNTANLNTGTTTDGVGMATGRRELAAASDDPGEFVLNNGRAWAAATIAIQPAPAGATAGTQAAASYDVYGQASETAVASFDAYGLASDQAQALFDLYDLAGHQAQGLFDVAANANISAAASFDVYGLASKQGQALFDLYALAGKNAAALFDVYGLAGESAQALFDVAGLTPLAGTSAAASYDVYGLAGQGAVGSFDVYGLAAESGQASYDVYGLAARAAAATFDLYGLAQKSAAASFDLYGLVGSEAQALYNVLSLAARAAVQAQASYDVYGQASKQAQGQYDIYGLAASDAEALFNIYGLAGADAQALYDVIAFAGVQAPATYDVYALAALQRSALFDVYAKAVKQAAALFDVYGLANAEAVALYNVVSLVIPVPLLFDAKPRQTMFNAKPNQGAFTTKPQQSTFDAVPKRKV